MLNDLRNTCKEIISLSEEANKYNNYKVKLQAYIEDLNNKLKKKEISKESYKALLDKVLKGYKKEDLVRFYNNKVLDLISEIERKNTSLFNHISPDAKSSLSLKQKPDYAGIDSEYLKEVISGLKDKKSSEIKEYTIYETNLYGKISNYIFEKQSLNLINKFPNFFENLLSSLKSSDIRILSKTYVSSMIFSSLISFIVSSIIFSIIIKGNIIISVLTSLLAAILFSISVFSVMYYYPYLSLNNKKSKIKDDLPFVVMHMAAVSASGAQPIAMFNMVLNSEEYEGLKGEIKKIINYVNLMGYDLNTALKNVASTTPSKPFGELLMGIVSTTESGGSLKEYLNAKSSDLMETYKLDRKKYIEAISTYSDIYTGILIAAPLLFFVTLAIIQLLGGKIFGFSIRSLAIAGTYFVIPLLNGAFLLFLNSVQLKD